MIALAIAAALGILLAVPVTAYALRLEGTLRARYAEIVGAQHELHQLSAKLVQAQEEKRRAIARELHDEVGQSMGALLVDLGNAAAIAPEDNDRLRQSLQGTHVRAERTTTAALAQTWSPIAASMPVNPAPVNQSAITEQPPMMAMNRQAPVPEPAPAPAAMAAPRHITPSHVAKRLPQTANELPLLSLLGLTSLGLGLATRVAV